MIGPLKKQADDASAFVELSEELKHLEINLFLYNYEKGKERIEKLKQNALALEEELAQRELALKNAGGTLSEEQNALKGIEQKGDEIAEKLSSSLAEIERVEGEIRLCDERMANLEKDSERISNEIEAADSKAYTIAQNETTNAQRIKQIEQEIERYQAVVKSANKELLELSSIFEDRVKVIKTVQNEKVEAVEKMADVKSALLTLEEKEKNAAARKDEIEKRLIQIVQEKTEKADVLENLKKTLANTQQKAAGLRESYNQKVAARNAVSKLIEDKQQEIEAVRRELATCKASAKMIGELKNSFEGYSASVKRLMLSAGKNSDIGNRIIGTFADVINVPAKYETAVEMCLGGALQNIVVEDEYDVKHIITHLRQNKMGRVTFLPLKALKPRGLSENESKALNEQGIFGVASDVVSYDDKVQKAVMFLLGRTLIADNNRYGHTRYAPIQSYFAYRDA